VNKKRSNVPVFFIYAGIIHAIGLALLLPMLITLPGPGKETAPKSAAIDVEIIPAAPSAANIEQDDEQTSALPSAEPSSGEGAPVESAPEAAGAKGGAKPSSESPSSVANVSPEAEPEAASGETPTQEESQTEAETKSETTKPAKATPATVKKPAVKQYRAARPAVRRTAKTKTKIAPFNGALSGLFTPGAPARRR
jgi:hypothetical protein